jgi:hypothetical protein
LDPAPQTFEKVLSVIERAIEQARRMSSIVFFKNRAGYEFRITSNSNATEEFDRYMEFAQSRDGNSVMFSVPNL